MSQVRDDIADAPDHPGVYLWVDGGGRILYVGKARSLRSRLRSYLPGRDRKSAGLLARADHVEWVEVPSDADALTLEAQLVAAHQPPYNVRLREPTRWPMLTLTDHRHPRLVVSTTPDASLRQWGPYPRRRDAHDGAELLAATFGVRTCKDRTYRQAQRTGRACLLADMGRCAAPCVDPDGYGPVVAEAVRFLDGDHLPTVGRVQEQMRDAAAARDFERAAALRDRAAALRALVEERPTLQGLARLDGHHVGLAHDPDAGAGMLVLVDVADGQLRTQRQWPYDGDEPADVDLLLSAVGAPPAARDPVVDDLARRHLDDLLRRRAMQPDRSAQAAADLADLLGLDHAPLRIECVDVSHLDGDDVVAGLSVIHDGRPRRSDYRTFRLPGHGNDDVGAIGQVVARRLRRLQSEQDLRADERTSFGRRPDLLLVDGGPAQLQVAVDAATDVSVDVAIASLAKREELLHTPARPSGTQLGPGPARWLLQHARDEAHRTALRAQRNRRRRRLTSRLDHVDGVGPSRRRALLDLFGGADGLIDASVDELAAAPGVGPTLAGRIHAHLHGTSVAACEHDGDGPDEDLQVPDR